VRSVFTASGGGGERDWVAMNEDFAHAPVGVPAAVAISPEVGGSVVSGSAVGGTLSSTPDVGSSVISDPVAAETRSSTPEAGGALFSESAASDSEATSPLAGNPVAVSPVEEPLSARLLNEFVYCPRLFYYEHVEGVFVENADTLRGTALHRRVDSGSGGMASPAPSQAANQKRASAKKKKGSVEAFASAAKVVEDSQSGASLSSALSSTLAGVTMVTGEPAAPQPPSEEPAQEVIHSRSVMLGSERLGVIAKMDLVEVFTASAEEGLASGTPAGTPCGVDAPPLAREVRPVDYKAGSPRMEGDAIELWDTDKMQLGLQILILRDNGYPCAQGVIYYRGTKQRVPLAMTEELECWVHEQIAAAQATAKGPIPPPLIASPKCVRCSLNAVCLPDETLFLTQRYREAEGSQIASAANGVDAEGVDGSVDHAEGAPAATPSPRRLMAARDDRRVLHLNTPGLRIGCSEEVLVVKEADVVLEKVRASDVSHVALFGNIQISTQAIQMLCEREIPLTYFSMGGWFYGITRGHELKNVFTRMEQFRLSRDPSVALHLARRFVQGKIKNHRTFLMRNHIQPPEPTLAKLKTLSGSALEAETLETLLGTEGAAANLYFKAFTGMIKEGNEPGDEPATDDAREPFRFEFTTRNRRPPTDPVNAMLSLAYSMLAKDCTLAAIAVGLDPYVGFYHQPRHGRPALALDMMEEFRPLIADSVVLTAINNRQILPKHFVHAGKAVNLSPQGRRIFFQVYEQRMNALITHPIFDYKVSYRRVLELQVRLLARYLTREIPDYTPFVTR
jgi:CRISPR-associated protein Cas1